MAVGKDMQNTATEAAKSPTDAAGKTAAAPAPKALAAKKSTDK